MLANPVLQTIITHILIELGIPIHRIGFRQLCMAIAFYAEDTSRLLSKEVYPLIAEELGFPDWRAVEHAIRDVIVYAWIRRDIAAWEKHFPGCKTPPRTNSSSPHWRNTSSKRPPPEREGVCKLSGR